jgi:DNA repair ATPase RecN
VTRAQRPLGSKYHPVALRPIREQLRQIEKRLNTLEEQYANLKGVTKEIDDIRTEVRAIHQHLGIERKIAAQKWPHIPRPPHLECLLSE